MGRNVFDGQPRAVLFDLDGTLIDSAPDITAAANELLELYGLPPLTLTQVRSMIGEGVKKLVERAFAASGVPLSQDRLEEANRAMAGIYARHLTGLTELMPGAAETLAQLHASGIRLGLVTNKPQLAARSILLHFHLAERFGAIVGGDAVVRGKPSPDPLLFALEQLGVPPEEALMVGDSATDVAAARAAGVPVVVMRGGYTRVPVEELDADLVCEGLADLPAALRHMRSAA
ncbi:phosphoglycolate phosphatase [Chelativorans sp. M5D2P16]|uniref:phosphoglycolate phosphatase n=1 Tax=Chelativorans sp. M5D2P16 TaxID=3095678 RepID=UPI002ACACC39|nr:phosphoglycolate phosphatase [Chelativorans sp. M5D2P16]MDZ5695819.1 phosphoglycolate phosphatase [Chelativorans sp. M5D2P16]